jgi:hypothetical protein
VAPPFLESRLLTATENCRAKGCLITFHVFFLPYNGICIF